MPLIRIEMIEGRSPAYKKAILDGVHNALVEAFKIPDNDRTQRLYELPAENFDISPGKTEQSVSIDISAFAGRSIDAKRALYAAIVRNLSNNPGIPGTDITIVLHDIPKENWGLRGGIAGCDINFGFKIDV